MTMLRPVVDRTWIGRRTVPALLALVLAFAAIPLTSSKAQAMKIQEVKSPGGIAAWLVEEHSVPLIAMRFAFEGGNAQDPDGKEGLANFLASMLDEGAGDLTAKQFQERMEEIAMRMSFDDGRDAFYGSFETLMENREKAVALLALAVNKPRFDAEAIERMRKQLLAGLAYAARDPERVAAEKWMALAFAGHPYGRPANGTPEIGGQDRPHRSGDLPRAYVRQGHAARRRGRRHRRHDARRRARHCLRRPARQGQAHAGCQDRAQSGPEAQGHRHERAAVGGTLRPARHGAQGQGFHARVRAQHHPGRRRHVVEALLRGAREARSRLRRGHGPGAAQERLGVHRRRGDQERADRQSRWS